MYINQHTICELLQDYGCTCQINSMDYCITSMTPFRNALQPYSLHELYLVESPSELEGITFLPGMNLLIAAPECRDILTGTDLSEVNYTLLSASIDETILQRLRDFFNEKNAMGLMAESILDLLFHETGIQSMVDKFTHGFNNPVFVFDAGFHLIACNYEMAVQHPAGKRIVDQMGMTEDEFRLINKRRIHDKIKKSEVPIIVFHDEIGCEQMLCAIDSRKDIGHIVINAVNRPFNDVDRQLMVMLKEGLYQQMRKEEFVKDNNGYPYEYFLKDLLDGRIATPKQYLAQMSYVNAEFSNSLYCMVIETARSSIALNVFLIRNRFEFLIPNTKTLMYNGEIIVLFCLPEKEELRQEDYDAISSLCTEHGLYAGISNHFHSLLDIAGFYKQALRAIEIGTAYDPNPNLFIYEHYHMEHMAHIFFQKESPEVYCHPKMKYLMNYDKDHDSQLAYSLYMYLIYERNSAAASEAMFIHRNTLNYRLTKIDSLVSINYSDPQERKYLVLSYEISNMGNL